MHIRGHQQGTSLQIRGNILADQEAKRAALLALMVTESNTNERTDPTKLGFTFTNQEKEKLKQMGINEKQGEWELPDGRKVLPKAMAWRVMKDFHTKTHWGVQALVDQFAIKYMCIEIYNVAKEIIKSCLTCQKINKHQLREKMQGGRDMAYRPFGRIQIDFTELPKVGRYKYLLVLVDHLTHYVEAFPTTRATTNTVVKKKNSLRKHHP